MAAHKIKKLPLVNADGTVLGLITAKDLLKHRQHPFATRDDRAACASARRSARPATISSAPLEVLRAGADVLVIDIAHGHSQVMERAIAAAAEAATATVELVAGNVATAEGARFLLERGVNAIKVGIGPGGGCTTRLTTNFGMPQVEALVQCREAVGDRVPLIADGGVKRDGSIAQALLFGGDSRDARQRASPAPRRRPARIVLKSVLMPESQKIVQVPFKVFRGMASIGAVRDRLDLEDADAARARGDRRRGARGQRAGARIGADVHPRHAEAPVLGDQLRRRRHAAAVSRRVPGGPGPLPDPPVSGCPARVIRSLRRRAGLRSRRAMSEMADRAKSGSAARPSGAAGRSRRDPPAQ